MGCGGDFQILKNGLRVEPETVFKVKVVRDLADFLNRFKDPGSDGVRVSLRVWPAIFEVTFPIVLVEPARNAFDSTTPAHSP